MTDPEVPEAPGFYEVDHLPPGLYAFEDYVWMVNVTASGWKMESAEAAEDLVMVLRAWIGAITGQPFAYGAASMVGRRVPDKVDLRNRAVEHAHATSRTLGHFVTDLVRAELARFDPPLCNHVWGITERWDPVKHAKGYPVKCQNCDETSFMEPVEEPEENRH